MVFDHEPVRVPPGRRRQLDAAVSESGIGQRQVDANVDPPPGASPHDVAAALTYDAVGAGSPGRIRVPLPWGEERLEDPRTWLVSHADFVVEPTGTYGPSGIPFDGRFGIYEVHRPTTTTAALGMVPRRS